MNFNSKQRRMPSAPSLADLRQGETAVLDRLHLPQHTSEHLMWLGFVPGAEVTAGQSGPGGDPRIYTVSGSAFALRRDTARRILVQHPPGAEA